MSGNSTGDDGGGIYSTGTTSLYGTIVAGNVKISAANDVFGTVQSSSNFNLIGNSAGMTGITNASNENQVGGGGNPTINPLLAPLGNYGGPTQTMPLLPGSPASNAGSSFSGVTIDQRGFPRPNASFSYDIGAFQTQSDPLEVNTATDDSVDTDQLSLRDAVNLANVEGGNQQITFASSLASGLVTIELTGSALDLDDTSGDLAIEGPAGGSVVIDAGGESGVFLVSSGSTAVLNGLDIVDGSTVDGEVGSQDGGGIQNEGTLSVEDCTISGNAGIHGGGISNAGALTIDGSDIKGNTATYGGGIYSTGILTVDNCTISNNTATSYGGGLDNFEMGAQTVITNSTISGNASPTGGGIYNGGPLEISDSTISGNDAESSGGGIANGHYEYAIIALDNCTIAANRAADGGGITNGGRKITVTDSTISGNYASIKSCPRWQ